MAIPQNKAELLYAITESYNRLAKDLNRVPGDRCEETAIQGHNAGTLISPANLVAYLIGWNELVLSWHQQRGKGMEPQFPAPGFNWGQLGELAEKFYGDHTGKTWPELLARLEVAKNKILTLVESLNEEDLYGSPWYGKHTAGRMIQLNTSSPYANARRRLRTWLRENYL